MEAERFAKTLGIDLYQEYQAEEAAKLCRVGVNMLRSAKKNGELHFLAIGVKQYRFLGLDLIRWKLNKRTKLENTTSQKTDKADGAELGIAPRVNKESLQVYTLETLKKRKSFSTNGL